MLLLFEIRGPHRPNFALFHNAVKIRKGMAKMFESIFRVIVFAHDHLSYFRHDALFSNRSALNVTAVEIRGQISNFLTPCKTVRLREG